MFATMPLSLVGATFLGAAVVVWFAGIRLSGTTERLSRRYRLGQAAGGLVILAIATNLPEIAISWSAARSGDIEVAIGNILGGIAIQTVVLVLIDVLVRRDEPPLMGRTRSLVLAIEGVLVILMLAAVLMATQLPAGLTIGRLGVGAIGLAVIWVLGLVLVRRARTGLPWRVTEDDPAQSSAGESEQDRAGPPIWRTHALFAAAALATLVGGYLLERTGDRLATEFGLSGVVFGATFLALATSLPEISTGLQSARDGEDELAVSDIFGGNAFLPVLFVLLSLVTGGSVLSQAQPSDLFLTALGIVLTAVYVAGLVFRPRRRIAGMGVDSLIVLIIYLIGLVGLIAITVG